MGLSVALSNALSGMNTSQGSLEVLSRNVANAGTPGYHRQSLSVIDTKGVNSVYARSGGIDRAFSESLQRYYNSTTADSGFSNIRAEFLDRLQTYLGKPGDAGSLDSTFLSLQNSLQQLGTSPENYATRATVVSQAQNMANTLNSLTKEVQGLRQETEARIGTDVAALNQSISSLAKINARLADQNSDQASRATLMDQRDRLVSQVSEIIDVRADYREDGTVALMTRSGVGIIDGKASIFEFQSAGALSGTQQFNVDPQKNGVGTLVLRTPSGLAIDLVAQNVLKSGELAGLIELRDTTLVAAQDQLDTIAAGLAQALSTVTTQGTAVTSGAQLGQSIDISSIRDGNDFQLNYTQNGIDKSIRVVRVDDTTKLPLGYVDANGNRVLGLDFNSGAAGIAAQLSTMLGSGFTITNPSGNTIQILDDGAADTTVVRSLVSHATASGTQNGDLGLNLFVDTAYGDFTNSLSGSGQVRGFAGRIAVNSDVVSNNALLVQYQAGGSLGDPARANALVDQLQEMNFASAQNQANTGQFRLGGTVSDLIAQAINYQGGAAGAAIDDRDTQALTMDAINQRLDAEYGVSVDDEMARLMELQNAYAANARVISTVQELLQRLMEL